jgi:hypothetical protein
VERHGLLGRRAWLVVRLSPRAALRLGAMLPPRLEVRLLAQRVPLPLRAAWAARRPLKEALESLPAFARQPFIFRRKIPTFITCVA